MLTNEQKELRKDFIGGSDSSAVLGVNPWKTRLALWEEKCGLRGDQVMSPAMERGQVLEDTVAQVYQQKTGRKIRRNRRTIYHKQEPWMIAHLDRVIVADERGPGVLEIKCPGFQVFNQIRRQGLPNYYIIQLQHYLAVTGYSWGAYAVFNADRWELIHFDVPADRDLQEIIINEGRDFYQAVIDRIPPKDILPEDIIDLPEVGQGELKMVDSPTWEAAISRLREAVAIRTEAEAFEAEAKEAVQILMGQEEAAVVQGHGARIYYKWQEGKLSFAKEQLFIDFPEIPRAKYEKRGKPFKSFKPYFFQKEVSNE